VVGEINRFPGAIMKVTNDKTGIVMEYYHDEMLYHIDVNKKTRGVGYSLKSVTLKLL
jgi:hypothetical protein